MTSRYSATRNGPADLLISPLRLRHNLVDLRADPFQRHLDRIARLHETAARAMRVPGLPSRRHLHHEGQHPRPCSAYHLVRQAH
jgi:hypothetical protein